MQATGNDVHMCLIKHVASHLAEPVLCSALQAAAQARLAPQALPA